MPLARLLRAVAVVVPLACSMGIVGMTGSVTALSPEAVAAQSAPPPTSPWAAPAPPTPPVTVDQSGSYAFLRRNADGTPYRYDPCTPLHYVVNPAGGPADMVTIVSEAFRRLSDATGMTFISDGMTNDAPSATRSPVKAGGGWAPILVAYTRDTAIVPSRDAATGGSTYVLANDGRGVYVTGMVSLSLTNQPTDGWGSARSLGGVVLHELAHVVGLDHVTDRTQLMYPVVPAIPAAYAAGDRRGLALVGRNAGCFAPPSATSA